MTQPLGTVRLAALTVAMVAAAHPVLTVLLAALPFVTTALDGWHWLLPPAAWSLFALVGGLLSSSDLPGAVIAPADEPELAELVTDLADRLGFDTPLMLRVLPTVDAAVVRTRLRGRRAHAVLLGWPLLRHLDREALRAVVAHELAHVTHFDDRTTVLALVARDRLVVGQDGLVHAPRNLVHWLLAATQPVSFALEKGADLDAARLVGVPAVRRALFAVDDLAFVYGTLADGWEEALSVRDAHPADVFDAAADALSDPVVQARLDRERHRAVPDDVADSHPPTAARVAALGPSVDVDAAPSPLRLHTAAALEAACLDMLYDGDTAPVSVLDSAAEDVEPERPYVALLIEATRTSTPHDALEAGLATVDDDSWVTLAERLEPGLRHAPPEVRREVAVDVVAACLGRVVADELQAQGWTRVSRWSRATLRSPGGEVIDARGAVEDALTSGGSGPLRQLLRAAS